MCVIQQQEQEYKASIHYNETKDWHKSVSDFNYVVSKARIGTKKKPTNQPTNKHFKNVRFVKRKHMRLKIIQ